jgi:hypothetical protein
MFRATHKVAFQSKEILEAVAKRNDERSKAEMERIGKGDKWADSAVTKTRHMLQDQVTKIMEEKFWKKVPENSLNWNIFWQVPSAAKWLTEAREENQKVQPLSQLAIHSKAYWMSPDWKSQLNEMQCRTLIMLAAADRCLNFFEYQNIGNIGGYFKQHKKISDLTPEQLRADQEYRTVRDQDPKAADDVADLPLMQFMKLPEPNDKFKSFISELNTVTLLAAAIGVSPYNLFKSSGYKIEKKISKGGERLYEMRDEILIMMKAVTQMGCAIASYDDKADWTRTSIDLEGQHMISYFIGLRTIQNILRTTKIQLWGKAGNPLVTAEEKKMAHDITRKIEKYNKKLEYFTGFSKK